MKVIVTGATGQLGKAVIESWQSVPTVQLYPYSEEDFDITNESMINKYVTRGFDVLLNCAAYTNVDCAEQGSAAAYLVNAEAVKKLAIKAAQAKLKFVHISTDYVFSGLKQTGYTEDDKPEPINEYGRSKLAGEIFLQKYCSDYLLVRTAWLYGGEGLNFINRVRNHDGKKEPLRVAKDQIGSPTCATDLAFVIYQLLKQKATGLFHVVSQGQASRLEWAKAITDYLKLDVDLQGVSSNELAQGIAKRPKFSCLDSIRLEKTNVKKIQDWKSALYSFLKSTYLS
ncbi:MAG: dTDP-4-dehydrorhamnose reductase [Bacillota bacterium]|jgi:dTDP-4-dehydrorhamnose reductase